MCINNNENISCRTQTGDDFVILCPEYIINNNSKESSLQHYNAKFGNIVSKNGNCIKIPNDKSQRKRRVLIFIDPGKVHKNMLDIVFLMLPLMILIVSIQQQTQLLPRHFLSFAFLSIEIPDAIEYQSHVSIRAWGRLNIQQIS